MIRVMAIVLLMVFSTPAFGQTHGSEEYRKILDFLDEFDSEKYSKTLDALDEKVEAKSDSSLIGKWVYQEWVDLMDDSKTTGIHVTANDATTYLLIRCSGGTPSLMINWNEYLPSEYQVIYRIDKKPAKKEKWMESVSKEATFYGDVLLYYFIQKLKRGKKLTVRLVQPMQKDKTVIFDIRGLSDSLKKLPSICTGEPLDIRKRRMCRKKGNSRLMAAAKWGVTQHFPLAVKSSMLITDARRVDKSDSNCHWIVHIEDTQGFFNVSYIVHLIYFSKTNRWKITKVLR